MGNDAPLIVVMGVSGCGKSTLGEALGRALAVPYADADDFHPQANIDKMTAGIPLDDADRAPWLDAIGAWLAERVDTGAVATCSALKRAYRDRLRGAAPGAYFVHLGGEPEVVERRVAARADHFMPASLVASQYATLEPLQPDEAGVTLDFALPPQTLADQALDAVRRARG